MEERATLEMMAQAICDGLEHAFGQGVEIGLHGHWDDREVLKRGLPLRAALVELDSPLADCLVVVSTMREENLRAAVTAATVSIGDALGVHIEPPLPALHEFAEQEIALEQLDALYREPTLHFTTPKGDVLIVVGSGLAKAAHDIVSGVAVPRAVGAAATPAAGAAATKEDIFVGAAGTPATDELVTTAGGDTGLSDAAPLQADSSIQQQADVYAQHAGTAAAGGVAPTVRPAILDPLVATAAENARAATPHSAQWEQLLSGVEVELSAELGRTDMRLGDITSLTSNSVLTLDHTVDEPVNVYVNGSLFGTARLVVVDDEYGIEMLEVFEQVDRRTLHSVAA